MKWMYRAMLVVSLSVMLTACSSTKDNQKPENTKQEESTEQPISSEQPTSTEQPISTGQPNTTDSGVNTPKPDPKEQLEQYTKEDTVIMDQMMKGMQQITRSESASVDFLTGMIPHHEAAIAMAESYLRLGGADTQLKQISDNIIKTQSGEIKQMQTLIGQLSTDRKALEENEKKYWEEYTKMFDDHNASHMEHDMDAEEEQMKSIDEAFAKGMIVHHQMAIDMAETILKYTSSQEVKDLSQAIIDAQRQEITKMQGIVANLK